MTKLPKVTAITLNYNQNDYTLACVNSVLLSSYPNFKLIVVENGSSLENFADLDIRVPRDERLIIVRLEQNIGYVGGVNKGLSVASEENPDYYLVMNNDTLIDKDAISALVKCAEKHERNAIVSGKVYNYDGTDTLQYIGNAYQDKGGVLDYKAVVKNRREVDNGQYDTEMEMGMLDDIFWLIPDKIFNDVGYYSNYFFLYGEQADYALRAVKKEYKLIYTPYAKLWHKGGITTSGGDKWLKSPKIEYWGTLAALKLAELHLDKNDSKSFVRKYFIKNIGKKLLLFITWRVKWEIVQANLLAFKHYNVWKVIKYSDNGYNPY